MMKDRRTVVDPATGLEYRAQVAPLELSTGVSQRSVALVFVSADGTWGGSVPLPSGSTLDRLGASDLRRLLREARHRDALGRDDRPGPGCRERGPGPDGGPGGSGDPGSGPPR